MRFQNSRPPERGDSFWEEDKRPSVSKTLQLAFSGPETTTRPPENVDARLRHAGHGSELAGDPWGLFRCAVLEAASAVTLVSLQNEAQSAFPLSRVFT